ncbi:rod shape-determining protein rodA [Clostridium bornimense]|uniref:Peptidoglycan glycosyltransferase RodA n=1 Tax=Clostridium bornimense TaxID=1216932 RepID=W6SKG4_9CLOT|nr:rod shape-determining protein RodA [Clostridium bornimense]CDM70360.1 rod shape-determining protein rodA [Clostridium bornimense]
MKQNYKIGKILSNLKINKKLISELDFTTLMIAVAIVIFGVLNIYSATYNKTLDGVLIGFRYSKLQLMWLVIGLIVVYCILTIDYSFFKNYAYVIYGTSIILLLINKFIGTESKGAQSWIKIGSFAIQPSEFAKLAIIIIVAKKIEDMGGKIDSFKKLLIIFIYAIIPTSLVIIQPDMGMSMVIFFTVLGMVIVGKLDWKIIGGGFLLLFISIAVVWNSGLIQPYQKERIMTFIDPSRDPLGKGYHVIQSKIAIGSGGFTGSGYKNGSQTKGGFIPEAWTDFIFSVVGEEWGFIGSFGLLMLYGIMIFRMINIAKESKDVFGSILVAGVTGSMLFSILENMGMSIGLMPITGITLPFMSYGGSSMLVYFMSLALVLNVGMRHKKINF